MMAKKTARNGKTGAKKLNRKKNNIRDLGARANGRGVKGGKVPMPGGPVPIPYPNIG